ncbi:MAG: response regulator, partial [Bdellovibrionales bacterium]|nr:response regulator [Bdellovibrionales bacterium]
IKKLNKNVLLVDDEEGIRELLQDMLNEFGMNVTTAENGQEALDKFKLSPESFDLIISDMKMPIMDGPTFLQEIRQLKHLRQPKFIFITGGINIDFSKISNNSNIYIDGYFYKPFNETEIYSLLTKIFKIEPDS